MITKEKFLAYIVVQRSGKTNMYDVDAVSRLSKGKLHRDDIINIMKNYSKYEAEFTTIKR